MDKQRLERHFARIREVLMQEWDPIGVRDIPEARDEYDDYVGPMHQLILKETENSQAIAAYLSDIAYHRMGFSKSASMEKRSAHAASALIALRREFESK